ELVLAESVPGGFSALYDSFGALETLGIARRGYFVEGLGGAQFALAGAVQRLRGLREDDRDEKPLVRAATDPAQPYGAALPWPPAPERDDVHEHGSRAAAEGGGRGARRRRPARVDGAYVVLDAGEATAYVERGGRGIVTLVDHGDARLDRAVAAI